MYEKLPVDVRKLPSAWEIAERMMKHAGGRHWTDKTKCDMLTTLVLSGTGGRCCAKDAGEESPGFTGQDAR